MWRELADNAKQLFTLWTTVTRHEAEAKEIRQELKDLQKAIRDLSDSLRELRYEVERDRALAARVDKSFSCGSRTTYSGRNGHSINLPQP
jgi:predicted RNase H-like nuclease (RuvC/YqgF family)